MKHSETITANDVMRSLQDLSLSPSQRAAEMIALHSNLVLKQNESMNLTRVTEPGDVLRLHIQDSASALEEVREAPDGPMADLGSGAGYPGIPLAILTGRPTTLVESVKKKAAFLQGCVALLDLDLDVLPARAEEVAVSHGSRFACCTARALSALPSLVELAAPLLKESGRLVALKGPISPEEVVRGDAAAELCGMRRCAVRELELPLGEQRTILVYARTGIAQVELPRRTGMAQRQPLA